MPAGAQRLRLPRDPWMRPLQRQPIHHPCRSVRSAASCSSAIGHCQQSFLQDPKVRTWQSLSNRIETRVRHPRQCTNDPLPRLRQVIKRSAQHQAADLCASALKRLRHPLQALAASRWHEVLGYPLYGCHISEANGHIFRKSTVPACFVPLLPPCKQCACKHSPGPHSAIGRRTGRATPSL